MNSIAEPVQGTLAGHIERGEVEPQSLLGKLWGIVETIKCGWHDFWFADQDLLRISFFRFMLAGFALFQYGYRYLEFQKFYTSKGMVPFAEALQIIPEIVRPSFAIYPSSDTLLALCYGLFLGCLVMLFLGVGGRVVTAIAYVLHLMFVQRNFSVIYGADIMIVHWLFYLSFVDSGRYFTIKNIFRRKVGGLMHPMPAYSADLVSRVFIRLMQIQLCLIYGYTGMEKLKGAPWWEGSALWNVLGNQQLMTADFTFLQHFPLIVAFLTFFSVLFEVFFPVLIWNRNLRMATLLGGVFLHGGIAIMMGFFFFSSVMIISYSSFVDAGWLRRQLNRLLHYVPALGRFVSASPYA